MHQQISESLKPVYILHQSTKHTHTHTHTHTLNIFANLDCIKRKQNNPYFESSVKEKNLPNEYRFLTLYQALANI